MGWGENSPPSPTLPLLVLSQLCPCVDLPHRQTVLSTGQTKTFGYTGTSYKEAEHISGHESTQQLLVLLHLSADMILSLPLLLCWAEVVSGRRARRPPATEGGDGGTVRERTSRGLVPQLLPNYTEPELPPPGEVGCNYAFMSCAYR